MSTLSNFHAGVEHAAHLIPIDPAAVLLARVHIVASGTGQHEQQKVERPRLEFDPLFLTEKRDLDVLLVSIWGEPSGEMIESAKARGSWTVACRDAVRLRTCQRWSPTSKISRSTAALCRCAESMDSSPCWSTNKHTDGCSSFG